MRFDKDYGREISFRDLFFHFLYRWRSILAAALIGAVLLGGYTYLKGHKAAVKPLSAAVEEIGSMTEDTAAEDDGSVTEETAAETGEANDRLYKRLLDETIDYCNKSVMMRVDPYAVWKAAAVYTVIPEEKAGAETTGENSAEMQIAAAYPWMAYNGMDINRLAEIYGGIEPKYIKETVSTSYISDSGSFTVETIGLTEEMAAESLAYFDELIMKEVQGDLQRICRHSVVKVSDYILQSFNQTVLNRQNDVLKNYTTYFKAVYPDGKPSDEAAGGTAPGQAKRRGVKMGKVIRFAVIGFVAGAFLMICLYSMLYLLSRKLRKARELTDQFGVPVYGQLNHTRARHPGKGVDGLIEKWEFRKTKTDREAVLENACVLVREHGGEDGILLTGTLPAERMQALADSMKERLGDAVQLTVEGSFLKNPRVIAEAAGASAVVIAEEQYTSDLDEIRRMLELLKIGNTPASGAIVI